MSNNIHKQFEAFVKTRTDKAYADLLAALEEFKEFPPCPQCQSIEIVKDGTHPRKNNRVQQYLCKKCNHSYTEMSIETQKRRSKYPLCPICKSRAIKNGYVRWTKKDGTERELPKYYCKTCDSYFYKKKRSVDSDYRDH